jgi:hypothetical protein
MWSDIKAGKTTWAKEIAKGKALPAKRGVSIK